MEHQTGAFFSEHEADDVRGFVVIEANDETESYRIAERWDRNDGESEWLTYTISEEALADRIDAGHCSYKQQLSDKQFEGVLNLADVAYRYQEAMA